MNETDATLNALRTLVGLTNETDATQNALRTACVLLHEHARPGPGGKQSSRARQAQQLALEVDDILRRWASELASPESVEEKLELVDEALEAVEEALQAVVEALEAARGEP